MYEGREGTERRIVYGLTYCPRKYIGGWKEMNRKEVAVFVGKMSERFARVLCRFTYHHGQMAGGGRRTPPHFLLRLRGHQAACEDHGVAADDMEQVVLHMQAVHRGAWEAGKENSTRGGKVVHNHNSLLETRNDQVGLLPLQDISAAVDG